MYVSSVDAGNMARGLAAPSPIGALTRKEIERYSLASEIARVAQPGLPGTSKSFEREVSEIAFRGHEKALGVRTIVVPPQILIRGTRAMSTALGSKGGYLVPVGTDSPLGVIDALRPLSVVLRAGASSVRLTENVAATRQTGGVTATWVGEGVSDTADDPALGSVSFVEKRVMAIVNVSAQLLTQAPRLVDHLLTTELAKALATALDVAAIGGGGGAQPLGVANTPAVPTQSGSSLGVTGLLAMQETVINNNGVSTPDAFAYVTTASVAKLLAQRATLSSGTAPVWQGSLAQGTVLGTSAWGSPNVPSATMVGGDFSRLVVAAFSDGVELTVSKSTGFDSNTVAIRAVLAADVAVEHPNAFVVASSIT
jgi:HK97 family phage major capsid protein